MKTIFGFCLSLFILSLSQVLHGQSDDAPAFDSCAYPVGTLPDQIIHYGAQATQATYDYPGGINNFGEINWGSNWLIYQNDYYASILAANFFGWDCGAYACANLLSINPEAEDLCNLLNAYLAGNPIGDPPPLISESHSASTFSVSASYADGIFESVSSQLLDPFVISHDENDGMDEDNGTNCPGDNPADSPALDGDDWDDDDSDGDLGMPRWSISEPYINLWIRDCPAEYTTSLGKKISFRLAYKQRDTRPLNTTVPPTGWSHNWFSYVHFVVPLDLSSTNALGGSGIPNLPGGVTAPTSWGFSVDASKWNAIVYSTANGENYFDSVNNSEAKTGLTLLASGTGLEFTTNTSNPFQTVDIAGFSLIHPDGSIDRYTTFAPPTFSFGVATNRGRVYDMGLAAPPLFSLGNTTYYSTNGTYTDYGASTAPTIGEQVGSLAADAVLVSRTDRYGNTVYLSYNSAPPFYLQSLMDYDGNITSFSYDTNGMLTNVFMPCGRSVAMTYTDKFMTSITDAQGMSSSFGYQTFAYQDLNSIDIHVYLSAMATPYGTTTFSHYEGPPVAAFWNPPSIHNGIVEYTGAIPVYFGWGGGTNRVNKACTVTHPDGTHELFMYRYDSRGLVPQSYSGLTPNEGNFPFIDDGLDAGGADPANSIDHLLSTRNSYHWNRQQYTLLSTTDFASLGTNDYKLATLKHWLQSGTKQSIYPCAPENNVSDQMSLIRLPSPDGIRSGPMTWIHHNNQYEFEAGDYSGATTITLLPNGDTRFNTTAFSGGLLQSIEDGSIVNGVTTGSRALVFYYDDFPVYDGSGNLIYYYSWLGSINPPDDDTIDYTYLNNGREIEKSDPYGTSHYFFNSRHQLLGVKYANGDTVTNFYGANGFLAQSVDLGAHATNSLVFSNGLPASVVTPLGLSLNFSWDNLERLTQVAFPDGTTISNTYNRLDLVARKDRLNHWSYAGYDSLDELSSLTDANGNVSYYSYCFCGGLSSLTDPLGNSTTFNRDNDGNVTSVSSSDGFNTVYALDTAQQVTGVTNSAGLGLHYIYDDLGNLTSVTSPAGALFSVALDLGNRPAQITDARGITTVTQFDPHGRLTLAQNPFGHYRKYNYSARGLYQQIDPLNDSTFFGYDSSGRLDAVTNAINNTEYLAYNPAGELSTLTDGNGHTNTWTYDTYGRAVTKTDGNGVLVETNGYNANGWLTAHWTPAMGLTAYTYDNNGNRLTITYSSGGSVTATYDGLNRLTAMTDAVGSSTFTYQSFGAFRSVPATQSGPFGADTLTFSYVNHLPQSLSLAQPTGSWTENLSYDGLYRLKSETSPAGTFAYRYNGASRQVLSVSLPDSLGIAKSYDAAGELLSTALTQGTTPLDSYGYTYDWDGRRTSVQRMNSASVAYGYDNSGQLLTATGTEPDGVTLRANENLTYTYDAAGNLSGRQNDTLLQSFQTDGANQLLAVARENDLLTVAGSLSNSPSSLTINGQSAAIYSDLTFAVPGGVTITNANGMNQLTAVVNGTLTNSVIEVLPASVSLRYDANGNLVWDGVKAFTYDCANELASVTVTNVVKTTYAYDGLGRRRIRKDYAWLSNVWAETNEVRYICNGMTVLQERNSNNVPLVTYTRGVDLSGSMDGAGGIGGLLARTDASGNSAFYNADGNGNITALVNGSGTLVAKYLYDSYGNTLGMWGPLAGANSYRFSSKDIDLRSGLYYYGYRYYEPNLQRWLNRDPIQEAGGFNLYGFVGNNPMNAIDPLGLAIGDNWDPRTWINSGFFDSLGDQIGSMANTLGDVSSGHWLDSANNYDNSALGQSESIGEGVYTADEHLLAIAASAIGATFNPNIGIGISWGSASLIDENDKSKHCPSTMLGTTNPNGGNGPQHGEDIHNQMIDDYIKNLPDNAVNIRKNQQQVDENGNNVGNNRPDVQYDIDGVHYNVEFDTNPINSINHFRDINANDPISPIELNF